MRRDVYGKMLKKRQQKSSTRLWDGVLVRERMQNKSHHHVHESRTFSKRSTWCKKTLTPGREALTKSRHELIPGHSPQTLTTRIIRKLYPRDPKHIRNQLRCDRVGSDEEEALERRGFRARVDLRLGAIDTTNVNNREGEKEIQSEKSQTLSNISNILKESTYAWEMHEHVTCKSNCIMGSAQSKPTRTQSYSTHLNAWQDHYNANVMQCMRF